MVMDDLYNELITYFTGDLLHMQMNENVQNLPVSSYKNKATCVRVLLCSHQNIGILGHSRSVQIQGLCTSMPSHRYIANTPGTR